MDAFTIPEWGLHLSAGLAMVVGLALAVVGRRIQFALRFVGGGLVFFCGMWFLLDWAMDQDREYHVMSRWMGVSISGLLGGLLCGWSKYVGGLVVGGMAGGVVSLVFNSFVEANEYFDFLVSFLASMMFVILILQFSISMYVILTSIFGSLFFVLGLDHFIQVGLLEFLDPAKSVPVTDNLLILFATVLALTFVGILLQFRLNQPQYKRLHTSYKF
ncbi:hypothetical protein DSO57_1021643 [Entomophthora muscae]|uniref:Uncharacterized protein n=1 Tax=Entomophthora muscae TaxID=34485 RepID=A0ACC2RUE8_9FUNG|nr:hypothetical protein DSO57_1021643 [Entomophthora muscae]